MVGDPSQSVALASRAYACAMLIAGTQLCCRNNYVLLFCSDGFQSFFSDTTTTSTPNALLVSLARVQEIL